jgi:hypothetical protein
MRPDEALGREIDLARVDRGAQGGAQLRRDLALRGPRPAHTGESRSVCAS